jgi:hypothetical protein
MADFPETSASRAEPACSGYGTIPNPNRAIAKLI